MISSAGEIPTLQSLQVVKSPFLAESPEIQYIGALPTCRHGNSGFSGLSKLLFLLGYPASLELGKVVNPAVGKVLQVNEVTYSIKQRVDLKIWKRSNWVWMILWVPDS